LTPVTKNDPAPAYAIAALTIIVGGCGLLLGFFQLEANDVFWHVKAGEWIVAHGEIPTVDPFSFTAEGSRWVFHNWLFDLPLHVLHDQLGLTGLIVGRALIVAALGLSLFGLLRLSCADALAGVLATLALAAMRVRFFMRPLLGSFFLFAAVLALLIRYEKSDELNPRRMTFWTIPLLVLVWANVHASVIFGLILIGTFWLARIARRRPQRGFLLLGIASLCAALVNPNGYRILTYPFEIAHLHRTLSLPNLEFATPGLGNYALVFYWVLIAVASCVLLLERKRVPLYLWIAIAGFGYLGLTSYRGIPTFSILLVFVIATLAESSRPIFHRTLVACTLMAAITGGAIMLFPREMRIQLMADRQPVAAADFAEEAGLEGRLFNSAPYGGYLIHRWYPERQVFIDGRDLLHRDTIVRLREEGYERVMADEGVEWILAGYPDSVIPFLRRDKWALVYFDNFCAIFARRGGINQPVIDRYEYESINPFDLEARIEGADTIELKKIARELARVVASSTQASRLAPILDHVENRLSQD
jgi:hypothetical protein